jgi:phenylalanyl-tRNA synthetase beta subunit
MQLVRIKRELAKGEKNPNANVDMDSAEKCIAIAMENFHDLGGIPIDSVDYDLQHSDEEKCSVQMDMCFGYIQEITDTDVGVSLTLLGNAMVKTIKDINRLRVQFIFVADRDPEDKNKYIATKVIKGNVVLHRGDNE